MRGDSRLPAPNEFEADAGILGDGKLCARWVPGVGRSAFALLASLVAWSRLPFGRPRFGGRPGPQGLGLRTGNLELLGRGRRHSCFPSG